MYKLLAEVQRVTVANTLVVYTMVLEVAVEVVEGV